MLTRSKLFPSVKLTSLLSTHIATPSSRLWVLIVFLPFCLAFAMPPLVNSQNPLGNCKDYELWFRVGQNVIQGKSLYPDAGSGLEYEYTYPPTPALFVLAPLSLLGYTGFIATLIVINCLAWYLVIQLGFRLYTGSSVQQPFLVFLLPFLASAAYTYDTFLLGQVNLVLLALMLVMFAALRAQKPWLAGGALALAAAIKAFPVSAIAYLVYRRQWRATAATLGGLILILVILPAPFRGFERNLHELQQWYRGMLADQSGNAIGQRDGIAFAYRNQSIFGVVHRLTRPIQAGSHDKGQFYVNVLDLSPRQSHLVAYAGIVTLGLIYVLCMPSRLRQTALTQRCEEAMLLLMVVFCSPIAWTYFYCWTFPAFIVIVHQLSMPQWTDAQRRRGWLAFGVFAAIMSTAILQNWIIITLALAATFFGGVGLFMMLAWLMRTSVERNRANLSSAI